MDKQKAIPQGYMTVGEVAKKMNTTVRTLQYYDKEGVLSPSAASEGGRRLYTNKDIVRLHQSQSMKYLGFSLDDIKNRLIELDTPDQVAAALARQAEAVREKIAALSESLGAIETLREEVLQMQSVDFAKYAMIVVNLQMKSEMYSVVKYMDDDMLEDARLRFDIESGTAMMNTITRLLDKAIGFQDDGVSPFGEQGQALAKEFWDTVTEYTGGDMSLLPKMTRLSDILKETGNDWGQKHEKANVFIGPALGAYFEKQGVNPFLEEGGND
jgi:DNA-binding transcriptional MerR regulator